MAVTGEFYNTLEFGTINSGDYGVYITGTGVYNAPARAVEMVSVPGRNGDVPIDMGHWDNIEVRYKCGLFGIDQSEMGEALMEFRNAIASQIGYQRLSDSYNPNEFRLGLFMAGLEFDAVSMNRAGEFELKFNCKPQRFLTDGEEMIDVKSDWSNLKTASDEVVTFEVEDDAVANYTQFKSLVADINPIQDLHGYDKPWVGGAGVNLVDSDILINDTYNKYNIPNPLKNGQTYTYSVYGDNTFGYGLFAGHTNTAVPQPNIPVAEQRYVRAGNYQTFTAPDDIEDWEYLFLGGSGNGAGRKEIRVQVEEGNVANPTYHPYSNICPISGRTEVVTQRTGKNLIPFPFKDGDMTRTGITWTMNSDGTLNAHGTASATTYYSAYGANSTSLAVLVPLESIGLKGGDTVTLSSNYSHLMTVQCNKEDGSLVSTGLILDGGGSITRMLPTTAKYVYIGLRVLNEATVNQDNIFIQLEKGSSATAYEPYNGNTITTALGRTVYGGEAEIVGGVLTDKMGMVDLGDLLWRYEPNYNRMSTPEFQQANPPSADKTNMVCSAYNVVSSNYGWTHRDETCMALDTTKIIRVYNSGYTDATAFKSAMSGVQLCYELATPRTIQLDPQTINTLVGVNNVWGDSGDVSVEYGVRPGVLVNPTQYESSPVIEIEGTGDVSLNDYVIAIDDSVVGEVELADQRSIQPLISSRGALTETIDMAETLPLLAEGDSFRLSSMVLTTRWNASSIYTYTVSEQPTDGTAAIEAASLANNLRVVARINPLTFTKGTAQSYTEVFEVTRTVSNPGGSSGSGSIAFTTVVSYDGASTLSITRTFSVAGRYVPIVEDDYGVIGAVIGSSSIPAFTGTVIIDSETGDAYRIEDGTYISLNKYIQLGAQLPTLRPGANIITYDDTIESLKIAPRWWRL